MYQNFFHTASISPCYGWGPTRRWIVQGGPAIPDGADDATVRVALEAMLQEARAARCVYVELRCFADYSTYRPAIEAAGFRYEPHYDVLIPTDRDPLLVIKDPKRRQLRQLQQAGNYWKETREESDLNAWYHCLRMLYSEKVHRPLPSLRFFRQLLFEKGCHLLVTESNEGVVNGGIFLAVEPDESKAYEWYVCGSMLATWAAMEWCWQQGIPVLDTMGAGRPGVPYGVRDFKLAMGGELHDYGRYTCVLRPRLYALGVWWINHQQRVRGFLRRWCPLSIFVSCLILLLCLMPVHDTPRIMHFPGSDKVVHALMYGVLTMTVFFESRRWTRALLWSVLWGGMTELLQAWCTAGVRTGDWVDWLADLVGAVTGCLFLYLSNTYRCRR